MNAPDRQERFDKAVDLACALLRNGQVNLPSQAPHERAAAMWEYVGRSETCAASRATFEGDLAAHIKYAADFSIFFDTAAALAAMYLRSGRTMPASLVEFAAEVLDGVRLRPARTIPNIPRAAGTTDELALGMLVDVIRQTFKLGAFSNNSRSLLTAARAVKEAMERERRIVSHDLIVGAYKAFKKRAGPLG